MLREKRNGPRGSQNARTIVGLRMNGCEQASECASERVSERRTAVCFKMMNDVLVLLKDCKKNILGTKRLRNSDKNKSNL